MSFSLEVFATTLPDDLWARWADVLAGQELIVERHPSFEPGKWRGGWAPFKLLVKRDASTDRRYPDHPIVAGFELDIGPNDSGDDLAAQAPDPVSSLISSARTVFHFSTSTGRSVADLRLQCLAAATLAGITRGVVYDPQQDAFFTGDAALENARREIERHESDPESSWNLERFE